MLNETQKAEVTKLYMKHRRLIENVSRPFLQRLTGEMIEDLTQSAWLAICEKYPTFDATRGNVEGWLIMVTRSTLSNMQREAANDKRVAALTAASLEGWGGRL